jgi:hypothetical protein
MSGTDLTTTGCVKEISTRVSDAAAVACAESGCEEEAVRISMDLDELLHEASTLHEAVALVHRLPRPGSRERGVPPG